jgi:multicomponent Na+:H+ antiporter subunit E
MARVTLFMLAFVMWLALAWPPVATGTLQTILAGVVAAALTAVLFYEFTTSPHKAWQPLRYLWFLVFIPVFLWECIKANIHVAYLVLHPALPIHPGIVRVHTKLRSDSGRTMLANCITLTPGTLTVDVTPDGDLYVHWIDVRARDVQRATEFIIGRFEPLLMHIFD